MHGTAGVLFRKPREYMTLQKRMASADSRAGAFPIAIRASVNPEAHRMNTRFTRLPQADTFLVGALTRMSAPLRKR